MLTSSMHGLVAATLVWSGPLCSLFQYSPTNRASQHARG